MLHRREPDNRAGGGDERLWWELMFLPWLGGGRELVDYRLQEIGAPEMPTQTCTNSRRGSIKSTGRSRAVSRRGVSPSTPGGREGTLGLEGPTRGGAGHRLDTGKAYIGR